MRADDLLDVTLSALAALAVINALALPRLQVPTKRAATRLLPDATQFTSRQAGPLWLSLLIPARNEAGRLPGLLASLGALDPDMETIILDDHSSDATANLARAWAKLQPRASVMAGTPLPAGWLGKPHACQQLAGAAGGHWLLFIDADVRLRPGALAAIRAELMGCELRGVAGVSLWPKAAGRGLLAHLVLPLLSWSLIAFLPIPLIPVRGLTTAVAANGQALAFQREAYDAISGHGVARRDILEDMTLARAVKRSGRSFRLVNATRALECVMYANDRETWDGLRKNTAPAFGGPVGVGVTGALFVALYAYPAFKVLRSVARGSLDGQALLEVGLGMVPRVLADLLFDQPPVWSLAHPASIAVWLALAGSSAWGQARGVLRWKGRRVSEPLWAGVNRVGEGASV